LLGQPEASWIDAKEIPHRLDGDASGVELGKDVAAFANTGDDAIVVWGVRTAKAPAGGDVLDAVRPFEVALPRWTLQRFEVHWPRGSCRC
jgi:hypothetical protein